MDISREIISMKRRALDHQIKENLPTLRVIQLNHERFIQEITPPYEREMTVQEMAKDEYAMSILIEKKPEDWKY